LTAGPRKKFDDIFSRLDTIHQRDRQTDGHRRTAKTALTHSVAIKIELNAVHTRVMKAVIIIIIIVIDII